MVQTDGTNKETLDASTQYLLADIEESQDVNTPLQVEDYEQLCLAIFKPLFNFLNKITSKRKKGEKGDNISARVLSMIFILPEVDENSEDDTMQRKTLPIPNLTIEPTSVIPSTRTVQQKFYTQQQVQKYPQLKQEELVIRIELDHHPCLSNLKKLSDMMTRSWIKK